MATTASTEACRFSAGEVDEGDEVVERVHDHRHQEVVEEEEKATEVEADTGGEEHVEGADGMGEAEEQTDQDESDAGRQRTGEGGEEDAAEEKLLTAAGGQGDQDQVRQRAAGKERHDPLLHQAAQADERTPGSARRPDQWRHEGQGGDTTDQEGAAAPA